MSSIKNTPALRYRMSNFLQFLRMYPLHLPDFEIDFCEGEIIISWYGKLGEHSLCKKAEASIESDEIIGYFTRNDLGEIIPGQYEFKVDAAQLPPDLLERIKS